ncbi:Transcriptional regulator, GntR family [uncultured Alphaproteobacteria bacterium]|uniref:Transcriptional regulator, GntR family n=1 Tax=uncultured Alphaproteobacteria bacterium TaxID=91750 RepID=A0A212KKN8_9PROT|nr:Transcriptional regulator, GntR family [uncultured Alphaproteobacteria bacterium]
MAKACTDSILDLIAGLGLGAGDRLPGERELARRLGFSRTTVRESLVALAARGRVEVRGRSGCYVGTHADAEAESALHADTAAALDALRALGPHLAARAAHRCTPEAARRLETVTARLGRFLVNRDPAQTAREYLTFFVVLAGVAGNPFLSLLARELAQVQGLAVRPTMDKAVVESFFALHVSLLQALQARDARRAVPLAAHGLDAFAAMMGGGELREAVA